RAGAGQRKGLRHEIVLAADAAHDLAVVEAIRDRRAKQRRHHRIVDETRVDPRRALFLLLAIELVGEGHRHHADTRDLFRLHVAECEIDGFGAEEERAMQDDAVDGALENAAIDQSDERLGDHLADAVEPRVDRATLPRRAVWREPRHDLPKLRIVPVAHHEALRQRIADLADADLERT